MVGFNVPAETRGTRVFVFNFFHGIKARGIPAYARELCMAFEHVGVACHEFVAPRWVGRLPPVLQNVAFFAAEQLLAPVLARWYGCSITVYPYNSCALLDSLTGRAVLVIHDVIAYSKANSRLSAKYIRICQHVHARAGGPIATVSRLTAKKVERLPLFRANRKFLWINPFYSFARHLIHLPCVDNHRVPLKTRVLLCTGIGANKDFRSALRLFNTIALKEPIELRILGFGTDAPLARRRVNATSKRWQGSVEVLGQLDNVEVVSHYAWADIVWVHSLTEGFGRCVVEGRMCGKPVMASNISAFRELRGLGSIFLYGDSLEACYGAAREAANGHCNVVSANGFNKLLESEIQRLLMWWRDRPGGGAQQTD